MLVLDQVDRIEEHDGVGGRHETGEELGGPLLELREPGGDRSARFRERGWGRVDADDARRRLGPGGALENQLRDGPRTAPQVHDDLAPGTDDLVDDPAVHLREERMQGERGERKTI